MVLPESVKIRKMWWLVAIACLIQATGGSEECNRRRRDANPEVHMNVSELICYKGYPSEKYEVLTDDGYYLTINRIPFGRKNLTVRGPKPVVLLQHGILAEASFWVKNMANNSFGFILADAGYDVWMGNSRGTSWSQRNEHFTADQDEFWDFSFHEMAIYDLPAMINFILKKTGQKQLYYVGHSQGATIGFIAFSVIPELSQKVNMFFALAPLISLQYSTCPFLKLSSIFPEYSYKSPLARGEFVLSRKPVRDFLRKICRPSFMQKLCVCVIFTLSGGFNATNLNMSRADVYTARYPDSTSSKNLLHWRQIQDSGLFRYFDYGNDNEARYNQSVPPLYKIEDMSVPTAVWSAGNDLIASPGNIAVLLPRISNLVYYENISYWNHWDFMYGLNAPKLLYSKIIEWMGKSL
ncbi:lysosomal acid lipase/cholesteryl ester hydrolase-like [Lacerta agilis]|uniref:lysosomal acid lipase/cholesteryl ester hydrolase-like n=1 Tax=Lacerta agilis TaxID=80427 RepID=UPI0014191445|nr:lysosomal acid lipase/cholesteryl ester hydrolase-like [Lacerta agilis]